MSLRINEWTRTHDDKCRYEHEKNMSQRPLRYITNNIQDRPDEHSELGYYTAPTHVSSDVIDNASKLRPEMTHLNEIQNLKTREFSTVPFMGSGELIGEKGFVDINSELRGNATRMTAPEGKVQVEYYTPGFLPNDPQVGAVLPDEWTIGGRSSRNDMRELYKEVCNF